MGRVSYIILNKRYENVAIIDEFESMIWTDRYNGYGDFELYMPMALAPLDAFQLGYYVYNPNSDHLMIIEDIAIDTDVEAGNHITVTGRSLESIFERRIIWNPVTIRGNFQRIWGKIIDENIMTPTNPDRRISPFTMLYALDGRIPSLTLDAQYYGETLYDALVAACEENQIGWRLLPDFVNEASSAEDNGGFIFSFYDGVDRSYAQDENPWIVFSSKYDNLLSSNYFESERDHKTACLALASVNEEQKTIEAIAPNGGAKGLERRELFLSTYIQTLTETVTYMDEEGNEQEMEVTNYDDFFTQLRTKGEEELANYNHVITYEGNIEARQQFLYGREFYMGDIVQVVNEYNISSRSRITEIVYSVDDTGISTNPTFVAVDQEFDSILPNGNMLKDARFELWYNHYGEQTIEGKAGYPGTVLIGDWSLCYANALLDIKNGYISLRCKVASEVYLLHSQITTVVMGKTYTLSVMYRSSHSGKLWAYPCVAAVTFDACPDHVEIASVTFTPSTTPAEFRAHVMPGDGWTPETDWLNLLAMKLEESKEQTLAYKDRYGNWRLY